LQYDVLNLEAVKRYHESRRRKVNDSKPERKEQVAGNKHLTKRYQRKRQVCVSIDMHTILNISNLSCIQLKKKW